MPLSVLDEEFLNLLEKVGLSDRCLALEAVTVFVSEWDWLKAHTRGTGASEPRGSDTSDKEWTLPQDLHRYKTENTIKLQKIKLHAKSYIFPIFLGSPGNLAAKHLPVTFWIWGFTFFYMPCKETGFWGPVLSLELTLDWLLKFGFVWKPKKHLTFLFPVCFQRKPFRSRTNSKELTKHSNVSGQDSFWTLSWTLRVCFLSINFH